jgi:hypothetical protein
LELEDVIGMEMDVAASKVMRISKQLLADQKQLENVDI